MTTHVDREVYMRDLTNMTQPDAAAALARGTCVLITGSIEQHGGHLPLGTDAIAALTIGQRVATALDVPYLQVSPVGVAPYHLPWPGSLSLRPATMASILVDICDGLGRAGVDRVLVINWHEGNITAIRSAVDEIQTRASMRVIVAESHVITNGMFPEEMEFTHAGAMETAAVLAHDPRLVRIDALIPGDDVDAGNEGHGLFRSRTVFPVMRDFREVASTGWYGTPGSVTSERAVEIITSVAAQICAEFNAVVKQLDASEVRIACLDNDGKTS
jgi:creatinine amidohydrolase